MVAVALDGAGDRDGGGSGDGDGGGSGDRDVGDK
jgi:hypothetical protein